MHIRGELPKVDTDTANCKWIPKRALGFAIEWSPQTAEMQRFVRCYPSIAEALSMRGVLNSLVYRN